MSKCLNVSRMDGEPLYLCMMYVKNTHTHTKKHIFRVITRGIYAYISDGGVCEIKFNTE